MKARFSTSADPGMQQPLKIAGRPLAWEYMSSPYRSCVMRAWAGDLESMCDIGDWYWQHQEIAGDTMRRRTIMGQEAFVWYNRAWKLGSKHAYEILDRFWCGD